MELMEVRGMLWLVRVKNPSVSAAWSNCWVISSIRFEKSWRDMRGMARLVYFVCSIVSLWMVERRWRVSCVTYIERKLELK